MYVRVCVCVCVYVLTASWLGAALWSSSGKLTTHLDHISHCKTASGTNWSNRWTYLVFIKNTHC